MSGFIDFHSHILPCVDDGSQSVGESIAMLQMTAEQGIRHVIATPHFYAQYDTPEHFLQKRNEAERLLRDEMRKYTGLPQISVGAEVYFFRGMSDSGAISELTFADKKCILIEMPPAPWTDSIYRELEAIYIKRELIPIIAHIDRYIRPLQSFGIPKRLAELPVLVQANAEFFSNKWTSGMAMHMLRTEKIHLLGSDCHNMRSRCPNLGQAVEYIRRRLGEAPINRIWETQNSLFNNHDE